MAAGYGDAGGRTHLFPTLPVPRQRRADDLPRRVPQHLRRVVVSDIGVLLCAGSAAAAVWAAERLALPVAARATASGLVVLLVWSALLAAENLALISGDRLARRRVWRPRPRVVGLAVLVALMVAVTEAVNPSRAILAAAPALSGVIAWRAACQQRVRERPLRVAALCSHEELLRARAAVLPQELRFTDVVADLDAAAHAAAAVADSVLDGADALAPDGGWLGLPGLRAAEPPEIVVLGAAQMSAPQLATQVARLFASGIKVRTLNEFIEEFGGRVPVANLSARWFLHDVMAVHVKWYRRSRNVLDVFFGLVGCVVLALAFPVVAVAVKLDSPGPVLYRQQRVGRYGEPFILTKFRTMRQDAETDGPQYAAQCDPRVTRVGAFLRRSRIDELPQFWNVLRGEMSIIGPRPERPTFVEAAAAVIPFFEFRHIVRPGITGWAQVTDGYASDLDGTISKLERDLYYLKHQSVWLDLAVLWRSLACVFSLSGR